MARSAALLLVLLASAHAAPPKVGLRYAASWDEALEEARARNVPIVVHRHGFY
jgi:hypothetical protein